MKEFNGDLILEKDTEFSESIIVYGNIRGKDNKRFNLKVKGNLNCLDLNCKDLDCLDLNCWDLDCWDLSFYAIAIAYNSFKCKSFKAIRENHIIKCLDGKVIVNGKELCE